MAGSSPEYRAFNKALPGLKDRLFTTFTVLRDQCQAADLLTVSQARTQFGSAPDHINTGTLLQIVLDNIKYDPANFHKFLELDVVKETRGKRPTLACRVRGNYTSYWRPFA